MKVNSETDENLNRSLEEKLEGMLNPVAPRSSYITELQNRLTRAPEISVEYPNYLISILVLSSGFILGSLMLLVLNRIFHVTTRAKA